MQVDLNKNNNGFGVKKRSQEGQQVENIQSKQQNKTQQTKRPVSVFNKWWIVGLG